MTITIQISNKKNRYGYIAKNDRVHDVVPQNLLNNSYGAGFEGDKGLANHGDLDDESTPSLALLLVVAGCT